MSCTFSLTSSSTWRPRRIPERSPLFQCRNIRGRTRSTSTGRCLSQTKSAKPVRRSSLRDPNTAESATSAFPSKTTIAFGTLIRIRGCVGEHNFVYFFLFLFANFLMVSLVILISLLILHWENQEYRFFKAIYRDTKTQKPMVASLGTVSTYLLVYYRGPIFFLIFCTVILFPLCYMIVYYLYLISRGMTMNEWVKTRAWVPFLKEKKREKEAENSKESKNQTAMIGECLKVLESNYKWNPIINIRRRFGFKKWRIIRNNWSPS